MLEHAVGHPAGLGHVVLHRHDLRLLGRAAIGPELLAVALAGQRHHRVGGVEDGLRGAVVALQRDHARGGRELLRKVEDVAHLGCAERIDALCIVAHHGEPAAIGLERAQDRGLQAVRVLVLVDQHMVEARGHVRADGRLGHHQRPVEQQVVVVEHLLLLLLGHVGGKQTAQLHLPCRAPREVLAQHVRERRLAVDHTRADRQAGGLERKALVGVAQAGLMPHQAHQVFGIAPVEDGEVLTETDQLGVVAQQSRADAVEGAGPGQGGECAAAAQAERRLQHSARALRHLRRGAAREREQQQPLRIRAGTHQPGHARGQRLGLAAARARDHQQGRCLPWVGVQTVLDRIALLRVERRKGSCTGRSVSSMAGLYIHPAHAVTWSRTGGGGRSVRLVRYGVNGRTAGRRTAPPFRSAPLRAAHVAARRWPQSHGLSRCWFAGRRTAPLLRRRLPLEQRRRTGLLRAFATRAVAGSLSGSTVSPHLPLPATGRCDFSPSAPGGRWAYRRKCAGKARLQVQLHWVQGHLPVPGVTTGGGVAARVATSGRARQRTGSCGMPR